MEGYTQYDTTIIIFLGITSLIGLLRGLSGEIFSILKLFGAAIVAYLMVTMLKSKMGGSLDGVTGTIVVSVVSLAAFFISNIFIGIFLYPISEFFRAILPMLLDKPLGLIVGFFKNLIVVVAIHMIIINIYPAFSPNEDITKGSVFAPKLTEVGNDVLEIVKSNKMLEDFDIKKATKDATKSLSESADKSTDEVSEDGKNALDGLQIFIDDTGSEAGDALDSLDKIQDNYNQLNELLNSVEGEGSTVENNANQESENTNNNQSNDMPGSLDDLNSIIDMLN